MNVYYVMLIGKKGTNSAYIDEKLLILIAFHCHYEKQKNSYIKSSLHVFSTSSEKTRLIFLGTYAKKKNLPFTLY